jgi:hypothetical protein
VTYRRHEEWNPPDRPTYYIGFDKDGEHINLFREILDRLHTLYACPDLDGKCIRVTLSVLDNKTS